MKSCKQILRELVASVPVCFECANQASLDQDDPYCDGHRPERPVSPTWLNSMREGAEAVGDTHPEAFKKHPVFYSVQAVMLDSECDPEQAIEDALSAVAQFAYMECEALGFDCHMETMTRMHERVLKRIEESRKQKGKT